MTGFDSRVAALASFSEGRTAIVWAWLPAAASMCWATTAAAPSSAGRSALRTSAWMLTSTPPPTATRPPSSSLWRRTPTTSSSWTGTPLFKLTAPSSPRKSWRTSWSWEPMLQERQYRLSGPPRRMVHRRGRHHRSGHYAPGSGEQAAGLSPANNRKGRDTHGYPALSSSSTPRRPVL